MTITLVEFGHFMVQFVNKNFIPLLHSGTPEHERSLQHWRQVTDIIRDIQKMKYWNLQVCLKSFDGSNAHAQGKDSKQFKLNQNSRNNTLKFSSYDNFFERKEFQGNNYLGEEPPRVNSSYKGNAKDNSEQKKSSFRYTLSHDEYDTKMSFESKLGKERDGNDGEGFDKLIQSFRKLCLNFQNNHKKLLKEDQNFKENYKEELSQQ